MKGGKAAGICNTSAEMLKALVEAMIHMLHTVLSVVWQAGAILLNWKRGLSLSGKKKKTDRNAAITVGVHCSVCRAKCSVTCY